MITLSKSGNSVTFTFDENSGYLQNGTIDVPVNSLSLITDESDMATFRKSASNDIFVSARYEEFGMSKAELEAWYKANMVGSTGGGGGGVDSGTVQTMIDESISGLAESSAVTEEISEAVSGKQDTLVSGTNIKTINNESLLGSGNIDIQGGATYTAGNGINIDTANTISLGVAISAGTGSNSIIAGRSGNTATKPYSIALGSYNTASGDSSIAVNDYNVAGGQWSFAAGENTKSYGSASATFGHTTKASGDRSFAIGEQVETKNKYEFGCGYCNVSTSNGKAYPYSGQTLFSVGNGTSNNARHNAFEIKQNGDIYLTLNGQDVKLQDQLGGGSTYTAGNGINIDSANTISLGVAISAGTGDYSIREGNNTQANANYSHAEGYYTQANNDYEHASGKYNVSRTGATEADKTLFTVGNGTGAGENASNAFEIRQNADIYIIKDNSYIKLQDNLGGTASSAITSGDTNAVAGGAVYNKFDEVEQVTAAGLNALNDKFGGLRLQKLTQSQYDALSGNTDSNTLYVIVN